MRIKKYHGQAKYLCSLSNPKKIKNKKPGPPRRWGLDMGLGTGLVKPLLAGQPSKAGKREVLKKIKALAKKTPGFSMKKVYGYTVI